MTIWVYRPGHPQANENGIVTQEQAYAQHERGSAPYVISDEMTETRSMCDGKYYTSKHKFRQTTRAHGCIEVGNETATLLKPRKPIPLSPQRRREDIRQAINQLKNR
jgi:hypothetical protein